MSNGARPPRVWILRGPKAGDFVQMRALATALGWPFEVKRLAFERWELLLHALPRPSVLAVARDRSDPLLPPWPDLVITAGRRNELPARWIRNAGGGRIKLVHVGRPWSHPSAFDLVISNRQYVLAPNDRVLVNDLPLNDVDPAHFAAAQKTWLTRLQAFPRPWTAVLLGGSSGPLVLTPERAARLGRQLERFVARHGGSLLITDSPRTPAGVVDALVGALKRPALVHRFTAAGENPYAGLIASADRFVITADSVSMVGEACATGRPVYVYDYLPDAPWWRDADAWRWRPFVHRLSWSLGPMRMRRDVMGLHRELVARGRVRWFDDDAAPFDVPANTASNDLDRAVVRVKAVLPSDGSAGFS